MQKLIELLESELGYAERSGGYTKFGDWYGKTVEFDADYTSAPWCDMYLSWAAWKLGYQEWVGQFAYTVYHAQWFKEQDAWGTTPEPGALVFFDWSGSKKIDKIDHVGIVTKVVGNKIHTIEGNIDGGVAKRKTRDTDKVVGYGYPEKVKARLEREASEKKVVVKPGGASGDNLVQVSPGLDLFALVPPSGGAREGATPAKDGQAEAAPEHAGSAARTASGSRGGTAAPGTGEASEGTAQGSRPAAEGSAPAPVPGKHAKPATAGTSALAVTPTAAARDVAVPAPELGTPTMLAPVLLAAVAILATAKVKQSKARLAFATAGGASAPSARRAPGRRAAGRRRRTVGAPVSTRELRGTHEAVATTTLAPAAATGRPSLTTAAAHVEETLAAGLRQDALTAGFTEEVLATRFAEDVLATGPAEEVPATGLAESTPATAGAEEVLAADRLRAVLAAEQTWDAFAAGRARNALTTGDAADVTRDGRVRDTLMTGRAQGAFAAQRRAERPRVPYQGRRRRLQERSGSELSAFVQDAPLRGRRHRRADTAAGSDAPVFAPRSTTSPVTARPRRSGTGPVAPAMTAVPAGPVSAAEPVLTGRRHRRASSATVTSTAVATPTTATVPDAAPVPDAGPLHGEPGDALIRGGYRGRRRAQAPV
ncbi:CHAP domain-containing protein [Streptosporangium fragile]